MEPKKEKELSQLCKALSLIEGLEYTFIDKAGESPDFLLNCNGDTLGVELINIFQELGNGNAAKTQSDLPKIGEDAVSYYDQLGGQPTNFHFCFQGSESISCSRRKFSEALGKWLFDTLSLKSPNTIESSLELDLTNLTSELKKIISLIMLHPSNGSESSSVTFSMFRTKPINSSILEQVIRKKEELLNEYKKKCKLIWLLIVLPRMTLSADLKLNEGPFEIGYNFDTVYVFDEYRNTIIKI